jgi:hypothetical protein
MMEVVMRKVFGVPKKPAQVDIPKTLKVYLEHHGPDNKEKEASKRSVEQHVQITGALPVVGKPLFAMPAGASHPELAIPYGKVVRITQ